MRIEILHIDDCHNWGEAGERMRTALETAGVDAAVGFRLLRTSQEAAQVPFSGSPTILIDGTDAFPTASTTSDLACRLYWTDGGPAGVPSLEQLVVAIRSRMR